MGRGLTPYQSEEEGDEEVTCEKERYLTLAHSMKGGTTQEPFYISIGVGIGMGGLRIEPGNG